MTDIHDAIDAWHEGAGPFKQLHEYLGMTWQEYATWAETGQLPEGSRWHDSDRAPVPAPAASPDTPKGDQNV